MPTQKQPWSASFSAVDSRFGCGSAAAITGASGNVRSSHAKTAGKDSGSLLLAVVVKTLKVVPAGGATATTPLTSAGRSSAVTRANTAPSPSVTRTNGPMPSRDG